MTEPPVVTWMHLSDLHVKGEDWQQDIVLRALRRDLPGLLESRGLVPDLLFVTGDIADRGAKHEYDGAFRFFDDVTQLLNLDRRQHLFVVAGNHDVDREQVGVPAKAMLESFSKLGPDQLRDTTGALIGKPRDFTLFGERLSHWCSFTETLLGSARCVSPDRPWRSDVVDVRGLAVGVLSLCSAWTSEAEHENGQLLLGERQLVELLQETDDSGAQLTVALMHHPLSWLHPAERGALGRHLEREADIVLHGHTHEAHATVQLRGNSTHATLGAGATYAGLKHDRFHGFSVTRLDAAKGELEVHSFTWSTRKNAWHPDSGTPGTNDQGIIRSTFSPSRLETSPNTSSPRGNEVLATRLRRAATQVYGSADMAGVGATTTRGHVSLDQIYVPQKLSAEEQTLDLPALERALLDQAETSARFVALGDPGSGKSTLCKHLAVAAASREGGPVPLLLTIRDWISEGGKEGLLQMAVRTTQQQLSVTTDTRALEELCAAGRVLLLVDGIDEAASRHAREMVRDRLHGFAQDKPEVSIIATSRVAGYDQAALDEAVFTRYTLDPFDDEALELFIHRWYEVAEANPADRRRGRADLLDALEAEPRAKALARNPLLATLIAMVHFSRAQLPGDRAKLYALIVELLLETWPAEHDRKFADLDGATQQPMLERLALRLQEQRAKKRNRDAQILIDIDDLTTMLADLLAEHSPELTSYQRRDLAKRWSSWLVHDCGLLHEQQPGKIGFLHLSVMEYMAGRALLHAHLERGHEAIALLVAERHHKAVWMETLLLMLGSENRNRALSTAVVNRLLSVGTGSWAAAVFLARALREEMSIGAELRDHVLSFACNASLDVGAHHWPSATNPLGDAVHFGKTHGGPIATWFDSRLQCNTGDALAGVLALVPATAFEPERTLTTLQSRHDLGAAQLAAMDFGPHSPSGGWARSGARRAVFHEWARGTPTEGVLWRSFEGVASFAPSESWIARMLQRAQWVGYTLAAAASHAPLRSSVRVPGQTCWTFDIIERSPPLFDAAQNSDLPTNFSRHFVLHFSRKFCLHFSNDFSRIFSRGLSRDFSRDLSKHFSRDYSLDFSLDFSRYFSSYFSRSPSRDFSLDFSRYCSRYFSLEVPRDLSERILAQATGPAKYQHLANETMLTGIKPDLPQLHQADVEEAAVVVASAYLQSTIAGTHAALLTAPAFDTPEIPTLLAAARVQNRWLNFIFDPLVDYATQSRPLRDHPDLHALLLTYGLVQAQTTWAWPDSDHWRAWFRDGPPEHWLPAHVWHLVRAIDDPEDPTHFDRAAACLDRNDNPEIADDLREIKLRRTPPEILALYGDGSDIKPAKDD